MHCYLLAKNSSPCIAYYPPEVNRMMCSLSQWLLLLVCLCWCAEAGWLVTTTRCITHHKIRFVGWQTEQFWHWNDMHTSCNSNPWCTPNGWHSGKKSHNKQKAKRYDAWPARVQLSRRPRAAVTTPARILYSRDCGQMTLWSSYKRKDARREVAFGWMTDWRTYRSATAHLGLY